MAIAGTLTAIYPWESPGGWHLLGACPVPLFSANWPQAALLLPGDRVRFRAIAATEYRLLRSEMPKLRAAAQPPLAFLVDGEADR
ncbi:MAG: Sporulation inhibitor KipI [Candidatus Accumulibacter vicinus]|uniref:Sporulation inhibitor KipI n=1 Tax=Candidatus Accumulibacter vicinus TaxID=2954382 RepID=A0A084XYA4_9PROT|nr:MAG: Sporulation inhibitor KipI [Candidatus Accumulibacter vicinus]